MLPGWRNEQTKQQLQAKYTTLTLICWPGAPDKKKWQAEHFCRRTMADLERAARCGESICAHNPESLDTFCGRHILQARPQEKARRF
jgi:hypothetical protein